MTESYADIIIDISHEKVDRPFQYRIPAALQGKLAVGDCVSVPFGRGNTLRKGFIVGIGNTLNYDADKLKEIAGAETDRMSVESRLIQLAWWMRSTYGCTMNQALKTVLPVQQKIRPREEKRIFCLLSPEERRAAQLEAEKKHYTARARLLEAFSENPEISMRMASQQLGISESTLKPMAARGMVKVIADTVLRSPLPDGRMRKKQISLNRHQQEAADVFLSDYKSGIRRTYLLYGITGSGKTEVYMEMMSHVLAEGKQVIVLIPEISLTYQTVMRFYGRFGDRIAILNSRLSAGERYDQWQQAAAGKVSILIGPRSALFAPFDNLGLIIMDEEHEGAYKSETMPRYHAREVAEKRAADSGASLVLGSATPSVESYRKAQTGEYRLLRLSERAVPGAALPKIRVVDMRRELQEGNRSIFSRELRERMEESLSAHEQIMLFINRRGYSNFVSCRSCGEAVRCPHCDVSLTLHGKNRLVCHYCGYTVPLMKNCPSCGSPYLAGFGTGTQKLEEMTAREFPEARILRMDADTTGRKGSHEELLTAFGAHEADILIGTQMIVKGHDFPSVTVMGIMAADLSLNTPDYRSAERTFELLTQAAGRAGRGNRPGSVVIQTYQPDHYAVRAAAGQNYEEFYRQEISYRNLMHYPPSCRMEQVLFSGPEEEILDRFAAGINRLLQNTAWEEAEVIGPVNAPVFKVNDIYRKILYIKSAKCDILVKIRDQIEILAAGDECFRSVLIQYDIS